MPLPSIRTSYVVIVVAISAVFAHATEQIDTVAGTGLASSNGSSGNATELNMGDPFGVEIGPDGALYVAEVRHHRIWRVNLDSGHAIVVVGSGRKGYSGDGGLALRAELNEPYEIRFGTAGMMYFVEMQNHVVRRVDTQSGIVETVAGTGEQGFGGDNGPATLAKLSRPHSIALDRYGRLYIADIGNHRLRRVDFRTRVIETIAGTGERQLPQDGQLASGNPMVGPRALFIENDTLWIALREGHSIWKLDLLDGLLSHVAGTGAKGYSGDGGNPRHATFNGPKGIVSDGRGNVYVVDTENQAIRHINVTSNTIRTIAGGGPQRQGFDGDGGPARLARLDRPHGICIGKNGALFIGDTLNHRVRRIR